MGDISKLTDVTGSALLYGEDGLLRKKETPPARKKKETPPPMPTQGKERVAQRESIRKQKKRKGRKSTILTSLSDGLGG